MANKPYDESVEVEDSEEVFTPTPGEDHHEIEGEEEEEEAGRNDHQVETPEPLERGATLDGEMLNQTIDKDQLTAALHHGLNLSNGEREDREDHEEEEDAESDDLRDEDDQDESELEASTNLMATQGAYDPTEFSHLPVTSEVSLLLPSHHISNPF